MGTFALLEVMLLGHKGIPPSRVKWDLLCNKVLQAELNSRGGVARRAFNNGECPVATPKLCALAQKEMDTVLFLGGPLAEAMGMQQELKRKAEEVVQATTGGRGTGGFKGTCNSCGEVGHKSADCTSQGAVKKGKGGKGGKGGGWNAKEVCKDFQKGVCPRGEACIQKHVAGVCHAFKEGKTCTYGDSCRFRHVA